MKRIEEAYNDLLYNLQKIGEHDIINRLETRKQDFISNEEPLESLQSIFPKLTKEDIEMQPAFRNVLRFIIIRNLLNKTKHKVMCDVFVAHPKTFNYKDELYDPLKNSLLSKQMNFIFPYDDEITDCSEDILQKCKYMIVEVSTPSIRIGIEIERAKNNGVEIIGIFKRGYNPELCLKGIAKALIQYEDIEDMVNKLNEYFVSVC